MISIKGRVKKFFTIPLNLSLLLALVLSIGPISAQAQRTVTKFRQQALSPSFNSNFNKNTRGWTAVMGIWNLRRNKFYVSLGEENQSASAKHKGLFERLVYQVRMKRKGCADCPNRIIIRGNPNKLAGSGRWKPSYYFQYSNTGKFSVWEQKSNDTAVALKGWTKSNKIDKNGWNTLKVVANGTKLKFYINGSLVWKGNDPTLTSGKVGLGFFRDDSNNNKLLIDWAKLNSFCACFLEVNETVVPGVEVSGGTIDQAP